jgi:pyruvate/2-oxoglutarate dehydrogenase complex dihydrolipoamide dehydrogenase (E3) component
MGCAMRNYDAIIIGTGQSGPSLPRRLAAAGQRVAIIERNLFGGTCVNNDCTPTKAMIASAYAAYLARRAGEYGVTIGDSISVDMKAVKKRKDAIADTSRRSIERSLKTLKGCTVYEGHARFSGQKAITVCDSELRADRFFINVGGRALIPRIPGLDQTPYLTNSSIMNIDFLPSHLIVLGGSYIGLEFAQMFRRFGSEITVIEAESRLLAREDEDVSRCVTDFLVDEGIAVHVSSKAIAAEKRGNGVNVKIESARKVSQISGTHVLVAIGRRPNTDDLGLEEAGVVVDTRGFIEVDDQLQTKVPGIWQWETATGAAGLPTPRITTLKSSRRTF